MDEQLSRYLDFRGGFFVEAGANDGYDQSNTYYLERSCGWQGLLVEGIPELATRCAKRRPNSTVVNCALVSDDYQGDAITMHYAGLMSLVEGSHGDTSSELEHLRKGLDIQAIGQGYAVEVPARTLGDVLDEAQTPSIDFLSLDVEGYELNVLKGLGLETNRPRFILVEARFFEDVNSYLLQHGYIHREQLSHHDHLYCDGRGRQ